MRFEIAEDSMNVMQKMTYYINDKEAYSYQIKPLIYAAMFRVEEKTTQDMEWISFQNLTSNFFVKESLFSLASIVGKPIHFDSTTMNKTRPSCAYMKV